MSEAEDDIERQLRIALMRADLDLKTKQALWETPKGIAALTVAITAVMTVLVGVLAGFLGYQIGRTPPAPPQVIILQQPAPAPPAPR